MPRDALIFDADDTLWDEQATLQAFEQAIDETVARIVGPQAGFVGRFLEAEERNIPHIGYGFASYTYSLAETLATYPQYPHLREEALAAFRRLYDRLANEPPPLFPDVPETLEALRRRGHRLFVLTRGIPSEQKHKLDLSGLRPLFEDVRVVQSKDAAAFAAICAAHGLDAPRTWMIGNSLRSDIRPALEAGLRAIWIPAATPWQHDAHAQSPPMGTLKIERFADLLSVLPAEGGGPSP